MTRAKRPAMRPEGDPTPGRDRMVRRVRRTALLALLALLAVSGLTSMFIALVFGGDDLDVGPVLVAQGVGLAALAGVALVVARRSSRFIEALFGQQDRLMLAVAHEVRSPLSRALVAVDEGLDETVEMRAAIERAGTHVEATAQLIDDLLEIVRVMSGAAPRPEEVVNLDEVAASAARSTSVGEATVALDLQPGSRRGGHR